MAGPLCARGFLAGTLKKKLGRNVTSDVTDRGRVYRVVPEAH
jgi:predicted hydrocarbon binding protein